MRDVMLVGKVVLYMQSLDKEDMCTMFMLCCKIISTIVVVGHRWMLSKRLAYVCLIVLR